MGKVAYLIAISWLLLVSALLPGCRMVAEYASISSADATPGEQALAFVDGLLRDGSSPGDALFDKQDPASPEGGTTEDARSDGIMDGVSVEDSCATDADASAGAAGDGAERDGATGDGSADSKAPSPDTGVVVGRWYQVVKYYARTCADWCKSSGKTNTPSPEGARCVSGEVRPGSALTAKIVFHHGCWPLCTAMKAPLLSKSLGVFCYLPSQTRDADPTDRTVGCFCT